MTHPIHSLTYHGHVLRFVKGPRFEGDLPWWIAEDVLSCVADLLGRPDLTNSMLRQLIQICPPEDRTGVAVIGDHGTSVWIAISEFELLPMVMTLGEAGNGRLRDLNRWFLTAADRAAEKVGGKIDFACACRGVSLDS
ncbi:MAG TPA: hypothetical protein VGD08_13630 [Stellaceae bacterium]